MTEKTFIVDHEKLKIFCTKLLEKVNIPREDAEITAETLVWADLRGVHSHGCIRLPVYIERILREEINVHPEIKLCRNMGATALLDGDNGLGQVIATRAMNIATDLSRDHGASWVGVRGSNHFGTNAYYAAMALPKDMIGIVFTVSNLNTMAPWGSIDVLLGNNPIAFTIPAHKEYPVVFDAALSVAAKAKLLMAAEIGEKTIPSGWAFNKEGLPTIDVQEGINGILTPIGNYKGTGLAFVISLLCGALLGAAFGNTVRDTNVGHLFCAIDIKAFEDPVVFKKRVDYAIREIKAARRVPPEESEVLMPGERGYILQQYQLSNGIPLLRKIVENLNVTAQRIGSDAKL